MSLDDIIKNNKKSGSGNSRGRGRGSGPGPARRFPNRGANRSAPYTTSKVILRTSKFNVLDLFTLLVPEFVFIYFEIFRRCVFFWLFLGTGDDVAARHVCRSGCGVSCTAGG